MKNVLSRYAYPAAVLLLLAALVLFFITKPAPARSIRAAYLQPEAEQSAALLGEWKVFGFAGPQSRTDSLAAALDAYQQHRLAAADSAFTEYLRAYPTDSIALFYRGLTLLYREEHRRALELLKPLTTLPAFSLHDDALWYAALASINTDRSYALENLNRVHQNMASRYRQPAQELLRTLEAQPGAVSFQVQSDTAPAGSSPVPAGLIQVRPSPAWWQLPWARGPMLLFLSGGALGLVLFQNRQKRRHRAAIEQAVALRTDELLREKEAIEIEKNRSEEILYNILPSETADELKQHGHSDARRFDMVTVLFCDFKEYTRISGEISLEDLVGSLGQCFEAFDRIVTGFNLEKIKTVGDCYICAGGLKATDHNSAVAIVQVAREILVFLKDFNAAQVAAGKPVFEARIGIHTGPVVAGIVGIKKYAYDIWGDTVNIAARMEQSSEGGKINISGATYELVKDRFSCSYRGKIEAKGKGLLDMYFVE